MAGGFTREGFPATVPEMPLQHQCLIREQFPRCLRVAALFVLTGTLLGAEAPGSWEPTVPLHPGVFSVAMGNQVMGVPDAKGRPQESALLLGKLKELGSPLLRVPGGDSLNTWSYARGPMHERDFLTLAQAGGSAPLWGVNVTTAKPADTEAFARALEDLHADPAYFELGNELYLKRWAKMTPTAAVYADKAAAQEKILRTHFPHAKFGVPLSSYWGLKDPEHLGPWFHDLAQRADFYDAVVLHLYLVPTDFGPKGLAGHSPAEVRDWAWSHAGPEQVRKVFGMVHGAFPAKEIWVTEWAYNTSQYISAHRNDNRYQTHQTLLAALYDARFMLTTAYDVPYVPIMTIWTVYEQPAVALLKGDRTTVIYELYRLLREARTGADGLAHLRSADPAVDTFGFFAGSALRSVMILNASNEAKTVMISALPAAASGQTLWSSELLPGWGNPANPSATDWNPPYRLETIRAERGSLHVPPNSITMATVN